MNPIVLWVMIPLLILLGLVVTAPLTGLDYHMKRIWRFQKSRRLKVSVPALSLRAPAEKAELPLTVVRDFVVNLQLGTAMETTLTGALDEAAKQFAERGAFGERLVKYVDARLSSSPEAVLEGLIEDFDSPHLVELLERVRSASVGGLAYDRVLILTVDEIEQDIRAGLEQKIQKAPTRLSAIMMAGLFMPILVLILAPLLGSMSL